MTVLYPKPRKQTKLWKTREGLRLRICDMTDKHLDSVIAFLVRRAEAYRFRFLIKAGRAMNMMSGEMAIMAVEYDIDRMTDATVDEILDEICPGFYGALILDKDRRDAIKLEEEANNKIRKEDRGNVKRRQTHGRKGSGITIAGTTEPTGAQGGYS